MAEAAVSSIFVNGIESAHDETETARFSNLLAAAVMYTFSGSDLANSTRCWKILDVGTTVKIRGQPYFVRVAKDCEMMSREGAYW